MVLCRVGTSVVACLGIIMFIYIGNSMFIYIGNSMRVLNFILLFTVLTHLP